MYTTINIKLPTQGKAIAKVRKLISKYDVRVEYNAENGNTMLTVYNAHASKMRKALAKL